MKPNFKYLNKPALEPVPGCDWASKMVLNPAIVQDPESSTLHMLFRATGPLAQKRREGCHDPYPIFLGYATSEDNGETWEADFSEPALSPALGYEEHELYIADIHGNRVRNYANGCMEDPRIFPIEGELYVSVACRPFPPGPYWLSDVQTRFEYVPEWIFNGSEAEDPFIKTARSNDTVTVLYKLDLQQLKMRNYSAAFHYIGPLTEGHVSDNRDVFLFPDKMMIQGNSQYVMLHRPMNVLPFERGAEVKKPSIYIAAANTIEDFASPKATHRLLATSVFHWEDNRIGASWPPIRVSDDEWLVSYHGKKDVVFGYTQSFMIVKEQPNDFPVVTHRCSERLMFAEREWEMPSDYPTPCLFTTAGIVVGDELIMSYGAADQKVGISWVNFKELTDYIRCFDENGSAIKTYSKQD
ncbi:MULTISPECIES: glycoside hydrolase family 130 protein [unclassified Paenibacillus]|uniref:glycoside hydrolase family 130 protein n=1 Tax=unclassified Paenibacillus TaxID=185978 RepID=UPI003633E49A